MCCLLFACPSAEQGVGVGCQLLFPQFSDLSDQFGTSVGSNSGLLSKGIMLPCMINAPVGRQMRRRFAVIAFASG
jgi:hypothetical protein